MTPPTVVVDASVVVSLFAGGPQLVDRIAAEMDEARLHAPHLRPYEVTNVIRRHAVAKIIDASRAAMALTYLADLRVQCWP